MAPKTERAVVMALAFVMTILICTALLAPFVLAAHFGEGWRALNYITVPGYLLFAAWGDRRQDTASGAARRSLRSACGLGRDDRKGAGRHDRR